jgi:poly(A) polymerase
MTAKPTRAVMDTLGMEAEARFVGGAVRDTIAGMRIGDVDIATPLPPDRVMDLLKSAGIKVVPTGLAHGTVTAVIDGAHFEITTLRRDVKTYGRHADVVFTDDWREDAARRDFTINAMSMTQAGEVFDYFTGRDDLAAGRVRFVGDAATRIREDVLRLLRFFRFHAHYGKGAPDGEALAAAGAAAHLISTLSGERIWNELSRILEAPDPAGALKLMDEAGVLADVLANVLAGAHHFARLIALVTLEGDQGLAPDAVRRLAGVIETDRAGAEALAARLKLSRADRDQLVYLVENGMSVTAGWTATDARRAIYRVGRDRFRDTLLISWAGDLSATADAGASYGALIDATASFTPPVFPIGGADAVKLGLKPGPEMGAALAAVEAWWLEEDFTPDRDALLARLKAVIAGA